MNDSAAMSSSDSNTSPAQTPSTSESSASQSSTAFPCLWDVSEVLAQRTTLSGDIEYLIAFKASWVPKEQLFEDCPALQRYNQAGKYTFVSAAGALIVPIPPGTSLAHDVDVATLAAERSAIRAAERRALRRPRSPTFVDAELVVEEGAAPDPRQLRISRYFQ